MLKALLAALAGVWLASGWRHLRSGLVGRAARPHRLFGLVCLAMAGYTAAEFGLTDPPDPVRAALLLRLQIVLAAVGMVFLAWWVADETDVRPRPFLLAVSIVGAIAAVLSLASTDGGLVTGLTLQPERLPWGEVVRVPAGRETSWAPIARLAFWLVCGFGAYAVVLQGRRGRAREAVELGAALLLLHGAIFLGAYRHGPLTLLPLEHVAFLGPVLLMGARLPRDIARALRAGAELQRSEENLRITLASIADGVVTTDTGARVTGINPAAQALTGWSQDEAVGRGSAEILRVHDADGREVDPAGRILTAGRQVDLRGELRLLRRDGTEHRVVVTGAPIRDTRGEITGVVLVVRDVTELSELEDQLRHARKMDAVGTLAGGIAHDFNNMLVGIVGHAELLLAKSGDQPELNRHARIVVDTGLRAADLTQKLLSFSRRKPRSVAVVRMHELVEAVVAILERSVDRRILVERDFRASNDRVAGDHGALESAVMNLAVNARDAMPDGGRLTFRTDVIYRDSESCARSSFELSPGPYLRLSVSDTGCGIPEDLVERIFEPYVTTKAVGQGTGLGLSAVYGTVVEHGGAIDVHTAVGEGSSFVLDFPLLAEPTREEVHETPEPAPHEGGTILVVDDEALVRQLATEILQGLGYTVLAAADGLGAIELFRASQGAIDAVLLDLMLPDVNGYEVFREIRALDGNLPVVVSTGYTEESRLEEFRAERWVRIVPKPYRRALLAESLGSLLRDVARECR